MQNCIKIQNFFQKKAQVFERKKEHFLRTITISDEFYGNFGKKMKIFSVAF